MEKFSNENDARSEGDVYNIVKLNAKNFNDTLLELDNDLDLAFAPTPVDSPIVKEEEMPPPTTKELLEYTEQELLEYIADGVKKREEEKFDCADTLVDPWTPSDYPCEQTQIEDTYEPPSPEPNDGGPDPDQSLPNEYVDDDGSDTSSSQSSANLHSDTEHTQWEHVHDLEPSFFAY